MKLSGVNNFCQKQSFNGMNMQKVLAKASRITSVEQRVALGVTATMIQPIIDLKNKEVSLETRKTSAVRSFAKTLVGFVTGVVIRSGSIKAAEYAFSKDNVADKLAKLTAEKPTKESIMKARDFIKNKGGAKQYAAIVGTFAALGIMIATNFLLDAPLTNILTNKLNKKLNNTSNTDKQKTNNPLNINSKNFEGLSQINKIYAQNLTKNDASNNGGAQ